jgi:arsenite methyltransferase
VAPSLTTKPDYGVDAPAVMRNFFVFGLLCLLFAIFAPHIVHLGPVAINVRSFYWPAGFLLAEGFLFLLYVKVGKSRHRDFMLSLHPWRGDEDVLDVGCGRGLLLAGAAKRIASLNGTGHATGIDVWSNIDMGGNSAAATQHNLDLEGVSAICTLISQPAQDMTFADATFDVIVSNLCIHNIYDAPSAAALSSRSSASSNPAASPSSPTTSSPPNTRRSSSTPASSSKRNAAASS